MIFYSQLNVVNVYNDTDCMCLVSYKVDHSLDVFESLRLKPSILSLDGWTLPDTHLLGTPFTSPLLVLYKDTNKQRLSIRSSKFLKFLKFKEGSDFETHIGFYKSFSGYFCPLDF